MSMAECEINTQSESDAQKRWTGNSFVRLTLFEVPFFKKRN